jgi:hypothetical protein
VYAGYVQPQKNKVAGIKYFVNRMETYCIFHNNKQTEGDKIEIILKSNSYLSTESTNLQKTLKHTPYNYSPTKKFGFHYIHLSTNQENKQPI